MTEKKFLNCVLTEGIILTLLGVGMLILPKLTTITFGLMICLGFIIYGAYKIITAFLAKHYTRHFVLNILIGLILLGLGVLMILAPMFSLVLITGLAGVYFLLESISTFAFGIQNRQTLDFWWTSIPISIMQFLLGLMIILGLPSTALWLIGVLVGINFLVSGMVMISMYVSTKYTYI